MNFEKWDNEEDYGNLMGWFSNKATEPESYERYMRAVQDANRDFKEVFGIERDVNFVIAKTDIEFLEEKYDKVPDWAYSQGFSATPEWHDVETPTVFMMANDEYKYWEDILKFVTAHELAHQKFYETHEVGWKIYQRMMFEGHAMHSAEKLASEKEYNWSQAEWRANEVNKTELLDELDKFNTWAGENEGKPSKLFVPGGEKWQNAEGYPITFQVKENILDRNSLEVSDLLEMSFEEWREEVEKSIENLYEE